MKKAVREKLEARGYISTAGASQEGRIRQLIADLTGIVNRRDGQALKQAAVLARIPAKRPKPAAGPTSFVREVALGKIVVPELGNYSERERMLSYRSEMRERRNDTGMCIGWEAEQEIRQFEREEETRIAAATMALKRGMAAGHVAAHFHLTQDEVRQMCDQLAGKPIAAEQD